MTEPPRSKLMPLLEFLKGEGKDDSGRSIDDILSFGDAALERNHDFIQWLFPLPEPSRAQPSSPILTAEEITAIRASSEAQANLDRVTRRMSDFYSRQDHWLRYHDHNHLRISRIIRSLALLRSEEAAEGFLSVIEARVEAASNPVNSDSRGYWRRALVA
jgi:Opioid growth factor receptor (OGFr) conserved region